MNKIFKSKLYKALALAILILLIGVLGFMVISGYGFIDALYMTVITVTTVGFGELHPFSQKDKLFTIFLILTSITIFGYTISLFSEYLISGQFFEQLKYKKVKKQIEQLEGHVIVCGFGRNGKQAIKKLKSYNKGLVVVEQNKELIAQLEENKVLCIEGDATTDETLLRAGVKKSSSLITALASDADNLFVVLTARQLNRNCKIISRASKESSYTKLKMAGADNVIMPDKLGGAHMASLVVTPDIIEFVDQLTIAGETTTNLEEIDVSNLPEKYIGKTILDLDLRRETGCTVIGFKTEKQEYIINPDASVKLVKGSNIIVLGRSEQITKLRDLF
ncbi:potassium channel protein [Tenacibaculum maritimum]|uniref:potassium channel family protein n=1 Tax=Tenacibaculum maritimum TaxID=107401 RepID=UPI0012E5D700|nr:potassium channel protein [Tenacibaculum maritimum]CAA0169402.1 Potassium uptake protein, TrkA family [Tenacibaculum maritimum]